MTGHASFLPSSEFSENVSNNIWLYLVFLGLTHAELAGRGQYSAEQLQRMETDPNRIERADVYALARQVSVPVRVITGRPLYWLLLDAPTRAAIEHARLDG